MINRNGKWIWAVLPCVLAGMLVSSAQAQSPVEPVLFEKILFPDNGNYYELIDLRRASPYQHGNWGIMSWQRAAIESKKLEFKGVQGRLAHIKTPELDSFLRITFRPSVNVWIGIRFDCEQRGLYYEDGIALSAQSYSFWHPSDWNRDSASGEGQESQSLCPLGSVPYHGAFMAMSSYRRPYWALVGGGKGWYQFFIEYPVGEKANTTAENHETGN